MAMSAKRGLRIAAVVALLGVSVWMSWDGVLSDLAPIQAQAETASCAVKKCTEPHGLTRVSRTPFGQSFVFSWKDGEVAVDCHRAYYVAGERVCSAGK